jgi:CRISPR-associated exonuclease Cas4
MFGDGIMVEVSLVDLFLGGRVRKERPEGVLYVTDLVKPCMRSAYYGVTIDREVPKETLRIFESGRLIEDFWVNVLMNSDGIKVLGTQLPARYVAGGLEIHGRVDALCQHHDNALVLHEVKSAKSTFYTNSPKEEHLLQLQFYMSCLGVDFGQVDYLDKSVMLQGEGSAVEKCFMVERDSGMFAEVVRRGKVLNEALKCREPPPLEKGWLCDYCLYRSECG